MQEMMQKPWRYLVLAAFFGLASGLFEVGYWLTLRLLEKRWFFFAPTNTMWMAPLADVLLFAIIGLVFVATSRVLPLYYNLRFALFAFSAIFFAKVVWLFGGVHLAALALLAVGLGVQTMRFGARYFNYFWPVADRGVFWMTGITAAFAAISLTKYYQPFAADPELPPAARNAPNVLLITLDTVRAQNMSLYGYHRKTTPNLERWARKGVVFDKAIATAPWTLPTHATLFTGRYPTELSTQWFAPLDGKFPTLAETLGRNGYASGGFAANPFYCTVDTGLQRGFTLYRDYVPSLGELVSSSSLTRGVFDGPHIRKPLGFYDQYGRKNADQVTAEFLSWLPTVKDRPFFAFLNYFDVHDPYIPPAPFDAKFGPAPSTDELRTLARWWVTHKRDLPREKVELGERAYDSCIAFLDDRIGKLLDHLDGEGILKNTVVVITSDHGEQFGERNLFCHGNSLYCELLSVPLVVIYPQGVPAGTRVAETVTLRDVPATILDLAEVTGRPLPGRSLCLYWESGHPDQELARSPILSLATNAPDVFASCCPVQDGHMISLIEDGKHYIRNLITGTEEIYDLNVDARERRDLAHSSEELRKQFGAQVQALLDEHADPRKPAQTAAVRDASTASAE